MTAMANLSGLFKEKYASQVETLYQRVSILKGDIAFVEASRQNGLNYNQPVVMSPEQGFTYAGPSATPAPVPLNAAISMQMENAQVAPYQMFARCVLDYETANRSIAARAFEPAAVIQMTNVTEQANSRLELSLLYGQEGLAVAASQSATSSTTTTVTFTTASWADATFGVSQGASVQFFTSAGALISSGADAVFTVTSVNVANKTALLTGTTTGSTALVAAAAGAVMFYLGARTSASVFNEMPGLSKITTNTGVLFNINAAEYDLWKGNTYAVGGALTFAKLQSAVAVAVGRGLVEDVNVYINPKTWSNLLSEQSALRKYDASYSTTTTKNGSQAIEFYSQNGKMTIKAHPFVREGDGFIAPTSRLRRVGSTDITFNAPTASGEREMFVDLPDSAGYQYKLYSGQTLFCSMPARLVKLTGIVNT